MIVVIKNIREISSRIKNRFRSRILEWEHTTIAILWGIVLLANPELFNGPSFSVFLSLPGFFGSSEFWGWVALMIGVARIFALCVNGYMAQPTAIVRSIGTTLGILLYSSISLGVFFAFTWSTALAVYPVISFYGLFALTWAVADVADPEEHSNGNTP